LPSLEKTLARPKSAIFRCPVELMSKFAGFKSYTKRNVSMADLEFFLGGGAPLRNGVTEGFFIYMYLFF